MRVVKVPMVILLLFFLVYGAGALTPADIQITSDKTWLAAGGDTSTITVLVANASFPVEVQVWSEDAQMGTIRPTTSQKIAASNPKAVFTFRTGTISGEVTITAAVTSSEGTFTNSTVLRVDHAVPKKWSLLAYPPSAIVTSLVNITVRLTDNYNNIVDGQRTGETISFRAAEGTDGGFWDGSAYVSSLSVPIGADGNATVRYLLPSTAYSNMIQITAPSSVNPNSQWIVIRGTADLPATITSVVSPDSPVRANNMDRFIIFYTVSDARGNPVPNVAFWRNTTPLNEYNRFVTNDQGMAYTIYGPKTSVGEVWVNATLEKYPEVAACDRVEFIHAEPAMWELTANPQTLASRDVKSNLTADIKAKVMDVLGNPVENQTVTFAILTTDGTTTFTVPPLLSSTSALTDSDGFATVQLHPGAFPLPTEAGYDPVATGTATIRATWEGRTKDIVITFKNYPFLRVETDVSPATVPINDTIDVTVRLIGDGWGLHPKPADVMLVTDRSGSMLKDSPEDRMVPVKAASRAFAATMDLSSSQDHVGLVSFGAKGWAKLAPVWDGMGWDWDHIYGGQFGTTPLGSYSGWWQVANDDSYDSILGAYSLSSAHQAYVDAHYPKSPRQYDDYAVLEAPLNWSASAINDSIESMVPSGGTGLRYGLYQAINEISAHGRNDAVRAIIVLTDGDYNNFGDPLARGSGFNCGNNPTIFDDLTENYCVLGSDTQNISEYARSKNIRIYSIGYASDISQGAVETLQILAESTGGKYYNGNAANIETIYRSIAGELKSVAGVDTSLNLSFKNLNVTYLNTTTPMPGDQVFAYQYVNGYSTRVDSWMDDGTTAPPHLDGFPYTINQTGEWNNDHTINFSVGNISLDQTWETTLRFTVLTPGSINIFGPGSILTFGGEEQIYTLPMPDTFVTSVANLTPETEGQALVDVKDLQLVDYQGPENVTEMLKIRWGLDYTGNMKVIQDVYYQYSPDDVIWTNNWIHVGTNITENGPFSNRIDMESLDVREGPGYYLFRVTGKEDIPGGAYDEEQTTEPVLVKLVGGFIRIQ